MTGLRGRAMGPNIVRQELLLRCNVLMGYRQCCKRVELLGEHLVLMRMFLSRQCSTLLKKTRRDSMIKRVVSECPAVSPDRLEVGAQAETGLILKP
jgi:hypothetical protein